MGLFTDGPPADIEALREYESSILDVAATEKIDLTVKLAVAQRELGIELERFLDGRSDVTLANVVVTDALLVWHTFHTLALTFRDAYHNQLNDRYRAKWTEYEKRARWASEALFHLGAGVTYRPIPRAKAPAVWAEPEAAAAAATYCVRVTWVGAGEEGSPSDAAVLTAPQGSTLVVQADPAGGGAAVIGWNVYAGYGPTGLALQNDAPVATGGTWRAPASGLRQGREPGTGQTPEAVIRRLQTLAG